MTSPHSAIPTQRPAPAGWPAPVLARELAGPGEGAFVRRRTPAAAGPAPASPTPRGDAGAPLSFAVTVIHGSLTDMSDYTALAFLLDIARAAVSIPGDRHTWVTDPETTERLQTAFRRHTRPFWRLIVTVAG